MTARRRPRWSGRRWFQLYLWRDRAASHEVVVRARESGYEALVLTVDTPVAGARLRDVRNGLTIPPSLSLRTFTEGALHPSWWFDLLTTEPLEFASLDQVQGTVAEVIGKMLNPATTIGDLTWLRSIWDGPLVVKGIQTVVAAVAFGARAALVGRAYLYGLMAGGERGVQRAADILRAGVAGTMALLGSTRVSDLRRDHVRLRGT